MYKNGLDAGKQILRHEGFLSFYKGLLPNILRMVPNTAIRFAIFHGPAHQDEARHALATTAKTASATATSWSLSTTRAF